MLEMILEGGLLYKVTSAITATIGYIGNIVTCIVIVCNKTMHTTTNIYLFNLAIADLLMLTLMLLGTAVIQMNLQLSFSTVRFALAMTWIQDTALNVMLITVTAFTTERYIAICYPFLARRGSSISKTVKLIFLIWIIGFTLAYITTCQDLVRANLRYSVCVWHTVIPYFTEIRVLVLFFLPFLIILILNSLICKKLFESSKIRKNRGESKNVRGHSEIHTNNAIEESSRHNRKTVKMLATVTALFFISWMPYCATKLLSRYLLKFVTIKDLNWFLPFTDVLEFIITVGYLLSSALHPIIYNIMSTKFREAFKELLKRCCTFRKTTIKTKPKLEVNETAV